MSVFSFSSPPSPSFIITHTDTHTLSFHRRNSSAFHLLLFDLGVCSCRALLLKITMLLLLLTSSVDLYIACLSLRETPIVSLFWFYSLTCLKDHFRFGVAVYIFSPLGDTLNSLEMFMCLDVIIQTLPCFCLCEEVK